MEGLGNVGGCDGEGWVREDRVGKEGVKGVGVVELWGGEEEVKRNEVLVWGGKEIEGDGVVDRVEVGVEDGKMVEVRDRRGESRVEVGDSGWW